ncbi:MAG: flagellar hook capping FlgD N-terminal domain-containing protein, partial [Gammaproteobacteria bacterium]
MNSIQDTAIFQDLGLSRNLEVAADRNELGQDDFLTLMTAQMKNQDPMKPLENGEFLGQLAQFGTVTGLEELKAEIQKLAGSLTSDQSLQAAGMLGREVLVPGATGVLTEEGEIRGAVELPNSVANLKISIYDQAGQLVRNMDLGVQPAGLADFSWDGL